MTIVMKMKQAMMAVVIITSMDCHCAFVHGVSVLILSGYLHKQSIYLLLVLLPLRSQQLLTVMTRISTDVTAGNANSELAPHVLQSPWKDSRARC